MSDLLIESSFHPLRAPHGIAHGCLPGWRPAMPPIQSQRTSNNFVYTVLFAYTSYTFHHPQLLSRPSATTHHCPTDFLNLRLLMARGHTLRSGYGLGGLARNFELRPNIRSALNHSSQPSSLPIVLCQSPENARKASKSPQLHVFHNSLIYLQQILSFSTAQDASTYITTTTSPLPSNEGCRRCFSLSKELGRRGSGRKAQGTGYPLGEFRTYVPPCCHHRC